MYRRLAIVKVKWRSYNTLTLQYTLRCVFLILSFKNLVGEQPFRIFLLNFPLRYHPYFINLSATYLLLQKANRAYCFGQICKL